jgi:acetolactate synthase regulatory subunit
MVRFTISAEIAGDTLIRLLNYFAQRGLCPSRVLAEQRGDTMTIHIEQLDLDERIASIIGERMRNCIDVIMVDVTFFSAP